MFFVKFSQKYYGKETTHFTNSYDLLSMKRLKFLLIDRYKEIIDESNKNVAKEIVDSKNLQ